MYLIPISIPKVETPEIIQPPQIKIDDWQVGEKRCSLSDHQY